MNMDKINQMLQEQPSDESDLTVDQVRDIMQDVSSEELQAAREELLASTRELRQRNKTVDAVLAVAFRAVDALV